MKKFILKNGKGKRFAVDAAAQTLSGVLLMQVGPAEGHGFMVDTVTLQNVVDAAQDQYDGQLRSYWTHDHRGAGSDWLNDWFESLNKSELDIPGFFSGLSVSGEQLVASQYEFYDYFKKKYPLIVEQVLEMADKSPRLIQQSVEIWGYLVYLDEEGTEYRERPEDIELQYEGAPVLRVTKVFASAFVADGAATDGLFAKLGIGKKPVDLKSSLRAAVEDIMPGIIQNHLNNSNHLKSNTMNKLKKALRAMFTNDQARLNRAFALAFNLDDDVDIESDEGVQAACDQIDAALKEEDTQNEIKALRAKADKVKDLEAELAAEKKKTKSLQEDGAETVPMGAGQGQGGQVITQQFSGATLKHAQELAAKGIQFAVTKISDLWVPDVWVNGMPEYVIKQHNILNTDVVYTDTDMVRRASGPGETINIPFFQEPDYDDEVQDEENAPTINGIASGKQIAVPLNRVSAAAASSLSGAISGTDPLGFAMGIYGSLRMRQRSKALYSMLTGIFGNADFAPLVLSQFDEDGAVPDPANLIDSDMAIDGLALMGEALPGMLRGVVVMHSIIHAALLKQQDIITVKDADGKVIMQTYKDFRVFLDDSLVRPGATSGYVYSTYFFKNRSIAMGDKPQISVAGEPDSVASLVFDVDQKLNQKTIIDRTRYILHPSGTAFIGAIAGQSATNAELATPANWDLAYGDVKHVGIIKIQTNG
ncbi:MAG: hypothetical protein AAFX93_18625 [Verrucomicrobiota bacterium]